MPRCHAFMQRLCYASLSLDHTFTRAKEKWGQKRAQEKEKKKAAAAARKAERAVELESMTQEEKDEIKKKIEVWPRTTALGCSHIFK